MNQMEQFAQKWNEYMARMQPGLEKTGAICKKSGSVLNQIGIWLWRLRKIFLSIPVVWLSVYLAQLNANMLPEMVGIGLQNSGEFTRFVTRQAAIQGPLAITAVCLLFLFLSRKSLYPWLISLFSLALPLLALVTNVFPA